MMRRLLLATTALLPLAAHAQTPFAFTDPTTGAAATSGSAISLSQMKAQGATNLMLGVGPD